MRSAVITQWLAESDWGGWHRTAMTGDASTRHYERLSGPREQSVILMDAPPESCGSQAQFVNMATHLTTLNLAAPNVLAWDDALGLMVLSDLGQQDFAKHLRAFPHDETHLYTTTIDVLRKLQSAPPPKGLSRLTPDVGAEMITLAFEWAAVDQSPDLTTEITESIRHHLHRVDPDPQILSLRDFHAENLIWRPDETGIARVGLLDFQDAFITHPAYDLASLLRDARRDVDPDLLIPMITKFVETQGDLPEFKHAFHVMAIQRNLRILGIFNRLARRDGKTGYLALIPRVRAHLRTDLAADDFAKLAPLLSRAFDLPETSS